MEFSRTFMSPCSSPPHFGRKIWRTIGTNKVKRMTKMVGSKIAENGDCRQYGPPRLTSGILENVEGGKRNT